MILVTGGCGFIGANFVLDWLKNNNEPILVLDKLTYAGNIHNLESIQHDTRMHFIQGDIGDAALVHNLFQKYQPRAVLNFAAESHVDRSIHHPEIFIQTNINGTFVLLEAAKNYWMGLEAKDKHTFRFLQISTDEVYGSLEQDEDPFTEKNVYSPNNPYAASKASADHLVRAYYQTYGLPTLITNCSNNYGPYQLPEKLIPLTILNALQGKSLLLYGDGKHIRDWLYVTDHCRAICSVLEHGKLGEHYNIGGQNEKTNIELVTLICSILDDNVPAAQPYASHIAFIPDRAGHDKRYGVDSSKIKSELGWKAVESFETGIYKTVSWYLENKDWIKKTNERSNLQQWFNLNYSDRETTSV